MFPVEARLPGASLKKLVTCAMVGVVLAPAANAEVSAGLSAGISRSDNIQRVDSGKQDESIGSVNVNFGVAEKAARSQANLAGDFSYLDYFKGTFNDELVGSFTGEGKFAVLPQRLELLASDTFGQEAIQSSAAVTPDNRENVNVFSAGPRLTLGTDSQLQVQLGGQYSIFSYQKTALDSDREKGDIALIRRISSSSTVSLNGTYENIDYDNDLLNTDFKRTQAFVTYAATGRRTELSTDVGFNRIGGAIESESGFLGRLQLTRRVSPYVKVSAGLGRELSDAGSNFQKLQSQSTQGVGTQSVQNTSTPFTSSSANLGLAYERSRVGFTLSGSVFDEKFDRQPMSDRTRSVIGASARRDLTPAVSLSLTASRSQEDYEISSQDFNELYVTLAASWRLGESLSVLAQVEHFDRNARANGGDYVENRISLRAGYQFGGRSQTSSAVPVQTGMFR